MWSSAPFEKPSFYTLQKLNLWCTTTFKFSVPKVNRVLFALMKKPFLSLLTPMIAFNSGIVTCFALSTACATCCWCSAARNGKSCPISAFSLFAISVCNENQMKIYINPLQQPFPLKKGARGAIQFANCLVKLRWTTQKIREERKVDTNEPGWGGSSGNKKEKGRWMAKN